MQKKPLAGMIRIFLPLIFLTATLCAHAQSPAKTAEKLNVFQDWLQWNNPGSLVIQHLTRQAEEYYLKRDEQIALLKTKSDWEKRQQLVRAKFKELIGVFPKKGPLNPEITSVIQKDGYRIEKIIFEPQPGFYEAGCLYIPDKLTGKAPAILNVIGHDQASFREQYYQVIITNLVKKGMIVFAIDPLGQGEHVQYYDPEIKFSAVGYSVLEHSYFGNVCFLSGVSSAKYFIWDGMRAIDYLVTRSEVDPERIGVTGFSGGGAVSAYVAAFDDRVKVSVPCSWHTECRRLLETKGVQDAESILVHGLAKGITFEDLLEVRSPKPTLMTFTSRDENLSLQGARDAFREASKIYKLSGSEDNLKLVEDDDKHAMTPKIRLAMYAFFQKHFNIPGNSAEEKTDLASAKELMVTPTGQIATYKGGQMVFDLNKNESEELINKLEQSRKITLKHLDEVQVKAKQISGYKAPVEKPEPFINGKYQRDGYTVELLAIPGEHNDYVVPILLFKPDDAGTKHPAIVYLHPQGKVANAQPGGEIEALVKKGFIVAAADVLGTGETENTAARGYTDGYTAVMIGRSMVGIRAGDIIRVVNYLKTRPDVNALKIGGIGVGDLCLPLMHAAAFDPSIQNISLVGSITSYRAIVMNRFYKIGITKRPGADYWHPVEVDFTWGIASVLTSYDLPDLIGCIAPRKVLIADPKDPMLTPASAELIDKDLEFPRAVYSLKQAPGNLRMLKEMDFDAVTGWAFE
jgi:dienelactone hydrolase